MDAPVSTLGSGSGSRDLRNEITFEMRGRGRRHFAVGHQPLVAAGGDAPPVLTPAQDVRVGDFVGVHYGGAWSDSPPSVPRLPERPLRGTEKRIQLPQRMTGELAFFLGAYLSEGHTNRSNWTVVITNSVPAVLDKTASACHAAFGLRGRITQEPGKCPSFAVSSKRLVEFMAHLGCGCRAAEKRVPELICASTRKQVLAFMQGVALDAYTTHEYAGKWAICLDGRQAIDELQDHRTKLGVINAQIPKWNEQYGKSYYELYAAGPWGQQMADLVPFLEPDKAACAKAYQQRVYRTGGTDVIPGVTGPELYAAIPRGRCGRNGRGTGRQAFRHLRDPRTKGITRASVERAIAAGADLPAWLRDVVSGNIRFVEITAVHDA